MKAIRINRRELMLMRVLFMMAIIFAVMNLLSGCAQVESQFGGKLLGASLSVAGITLSVSGSIPSGPPAAPVTANASAP